VEQEARDRTENSRSGPGSALASVTRDFDRGPRQGAGRQGVAVLLAGEQRRQRFRLASENLAAGLDDVFGKDVAQPQIEMDSKRQPCSARRLEHSPPPLWCNGLEVHLGDVDVFVAT
jgi:hypothetical protein